MAGTATTEDGLCCVCDLLLYILFVFVPSRLGQSSSSSSSSQKPAFPFLFRFDCPHPHHKTNEFITLQNDLKWLPHTVRNLLHISSMMVAVAAVAAAQVDAIPIAYSHTIDSSKHTPHTLTHIPAEITAEFIPPKLKNTISEPKNEKRELKKIYANDDQRRPVATFSFHQRNTADNTATTTIIIVITIMPIRMLQNRRPLYCVVLFRGANTFHFSAEDYRISSNEKCVAASVGSKFFFITLYHYEAHSL